MSEFAWSFSHAETFDTCPVQYEAKYVTKVIKFQETEATRWGNHVHQVAGDYLRDGTPVPDNVPYKAQFDWVAARAERFGAELILEAEVGLTRDWGPCKYFDREKTVWCRGKIDVLMIRPDGVAEVLDWKTGKPKMARTQLMIYALFVLAHYPAVKEVRAGFVWLKDNQVTPPVAYLRMNQNAYRDHWERKYASMKAARELGVFVPTPNGLCKNWCDVTYCDFHGKGARRN